jgi:protein-tyrosine-phosphatase
LKVLFVCTGNTCRSVLAEHLLAKLARERGLDWEARSAGTAADPTFPVPGHVRALLGELGVKDLHHQAKPVSPQTLAWADLVLAMTDTQMRELWTDFPESKQRTHLLREYAGLGPEDVEDPIGGDMALYRRSLAAISEALERVLDKQAPKSPKGRKKRVKQG